MSKKEFANISVAVAILIVAAVACVGVNQQGKKPAIGTPVIERISPDAAVIGMEVSVIGSGFTSTGNSLHFGAGFAYINDLTSSDGKTIIFTLPEFFDTCNPDGSECAQLVSQPVPGQTYDVTVINANGRSNSIKFTVAREAGLVHLEEITNFEECARAGYPVAESYPRQCWTPDGKQFVEELPASPSTRPNWVPYRKDGTCPPGYVDYGIPLQCVTPEYMEYCMQGHPCPICLAESSLIDTPRGVLAVKDVQVGMQVWTTDRAGNRVSGVVVKTSNVAAPPTHHMVHLVLDDGRELLASPGHPTVDGRTIGDLMVNDFYDGARVITISRVPYGSTATYDILPSGETGFYWANGILVGSTLK